VKESNISLDITTSIKPDTYWEVRNAIDVNDFRPIVSTDSFFVLTNDHKMIPFGLED
jgi:hypothetical protein